MSREWDIRELAAHDVLRLGGTDRTDNPHAPTGRRDLGERVVRRVPTTREQIDSTWRSSDRWTKELVRELARLGYDVESMVAVAQDDELTSLSLGVGQALPWASAVDTVRGLADDFGWDQAQIAGLEEDLADFTRDNPQGSYTAEVTSTGTAAQVTGTLDFDRGSGFTVLTITFAPAA